MVLGAGTLLLIVSTLLGANRLFSNNPDPSDGSSPSGDPRNTSPTTSSAEPPGKQIKFSSVTASSSYSDQFGPENLIDGNISTYWNDASLHGAGAELIFEFANPVVIESLLLQNIVSEFDFARNHRIHEYEIATDDIRSVIRGELADKKGTQSITVGSSSTTQLILRVVSVYEADQIAGRAPFEELGLAEVYPFGRLADG